MGLRDFWNEHCFALHKGQIGVENIKTPRDVMQLLTGQKWEHQEHGVLGDVASLHTKPENPLVYATLHAFVDAGFNVQEQKFEDSPERARLILEHPSRNIQLDTRLTTYEEVIEQDMAKHEITGADAEDYRNFWKGSPNYTNVEIILRGDVEQMKPIIDELSETYKDTLAMAQRNNLTALNAQNMLWHYLNDSPEMESAPRRSNP